MSISNPRYRRYNRRILGWLAAAHPHLFIRGFWNREKGKESFFSMSQWQVPYTYCSDPRDKIYSTLGLAAEWEHLDQRFLPVDYKLSVAEVFCRATKYLLMRTTSLDNLSTVSMKRQTPKDYRLPSWCPDYSRVAATEAPSILMDYPGDASTWWSASMSGHCIQSPLNEPASILRLRGIQRDHIEFSCPLSSDPWPLASPVVLGFLLRKVIKVHSSGRYVYIFLAILQPTAFQRVRRQFREPRNDTDADMIVQVRLSLSPVHAVLFCMEESAVRTCRSFRPRLKMAWRKA